MTTICSAETVMPAINRGVNPGIAYTLNGSILFRARLQPSCIPGLWFYLVTPLALPQTQKPYCPYAQRSHDAL